MSEFPWNETNITFTWPSSVFNPFKFLDGTIKLHAVLPLLQTNCGEEHFLFLSKLFWNIFQAWNNMWWLENGWFAAKEESLNTIK